MPEIRPVPVAMSVIITELALAPVGSEISWQAALHEVAYRGTAGLLLRSVGAPWNAPWHQDLWRVNGPSTTLGLALFLVLLGGATLLLARGSHSTGTLFVGIWGSAMLALALSQILRLLLAGGAERRYTADRDPVSFALYAGGGAVSHALYFGWIAALIGSLVAMVTSRADGHPSFRPGSPRRLG
jgi:hypothetical protein